MEMRPDLAAKVAQCIARWSEIEVILGAFLGFLLHANERAALAMYSGLENRSAQLRLITSAAQATLPPRHYAAIEALISKFVRPAMRERDRLAHWNWGYSDQLPDALLLADPSRNLKSLMTVLGGQPRGQPNDVLTSFDEIFVVRDGDLENIKKRGTIVKDHLLVAMASVWEKNTPEQRAEHYDLLCGIPEIRAAIDAVKGAS